MRGVRGMQTVDTPVEIPNASSATLERLAEIRRLAEAAIGKPALLGPDVDITRFTTVSERQRLGSLASLEKQVRETALMSGFTADESERSASTLSTRTRGQACSTRPRQAAMARAASASPAARRSKRAAAGR